MRIRRTRSRLDANAFRLRVCFFCRELTSKLSSTGESNRIITQALRMKQEEVEALSAKYESLSQQFESAGGLQALAAVRTAADTTAVMDGTRTMGRTQEDNQLAVRFDGLLCAPGGCTADAVRCSAVRSWCRAYACRFSSYDVHTVSIFHVEELILVASQCALPTMIVVAGSVCCDVSVSSCGRACFEIMCVAGPSCGLLRAEQ